MNLNRVLSLVLLVFISASFQGCMLRAMRTDAIFNPWLGKTKDERVKRIGLPERCMTLSAGGEVCEWVFKDVSMASVDCPPDLVYGGHRCSGGGSHSKEEHVVFTYDRNGIATEWNYRWRDGQLQGQRSSRDSQTRQAMKETRPADDSLSQDDLRSLGTPVGDKGDRAGDNRSQAKIEMQEKAPPVRRSPREIVLFGFPLEAGASRQQIQEAILNRGGKLLSHLHLPERDEFDSSRWIDGSDKAGAVYTKSGQFVGLVISWSIADSQSERVTLTVGVRS